MVKITPIKGKDLRGIKLFRLTNEEETHNGFTYKTGKNVDTIPFNTDLDNNGCVPGGLYFSDKSILTFMDYDTRYIREVTLDDEEDVIHIRHETDVFYNTKYRAHSITLGERMDLRDISTWKYLVEQGVNVSTYCTFVWVVENGHLDVVKYLVEQGADIHAYNDYALKFAADNGHLDVVKYLVEQGADIHAYNDYALICSSSNGHLEVVKYLVEQDANIHADDDAALRWASKKGHLEVVNYMKSLF